jgi:hypothetical protein
MQRFIFLVQLMYCPVQLESGDHAHVASFPATAEIKQWDGATISGTYFEKKRKYIPHNRPWRTIGLWDVKDPALFWQAAHRWQQGCQPYASAALYSPETLFFCFWFRDRRL